VLLSEHPNASLAELELPEFAADFAQTISARRLTSLVLTADRTFASAVAPLVLELNAANGALQPSSGWRKWFS
jgi:hypothetical protein